MLPQVYEIYPAVVMDPPDISLVVVIVVVDEIPLPRMVELVVELLPTVVVMLTVDDVISPDADMLVIHCFAVRCIDKLRLHIIMCGSHMKHCRTKLISKLICIST